MAGFPEWIFERQLPSQLKQGPWLYNTLFLDALYSSWKDQFADYIGAQEADRHVMSLLEEGRLFTDDEKLTIHAWKNDEIVAVAALRSLGQINLITMLEVDPQHRGLGIGSQLLTALCTASEPLVAHVSIHQPRVLQFYQSAGFNVLHRSKEMHGAHCLEFDVVAKSRSTAG